MANRVSTEHQTAEERSLVLIVDDEEMICQFLANILARVGHRTLSASNGREALMLLDRFDVAIDLLVTDVNLPGVSGLELAAFSSDTCPQRPILIISGKPLPCGTQSARWNFLQKPFAPSRFVDAVSAILDGTRQTRENQQ